MKRADLSLPTFEHCCGRNHVWLFCSFLQIVREDIADTLKMAGGGQREPGTLDCWATEPSSGLTISTLPLDFLCVWITFNQLFCNCILTASGVLVLGVWRKQSQASEASRASPRESLDLFGVLVVCEYHLQLCSCHLVLHIQGKIPPWIPFL